MFRNLSQMLGDYLSHCCEFLHQKGVCAREQADFQMKSSQSELDRGTVLICL